MSVCNTIQESEFVAKEGEKAEDHRFQIENTAKLCFLVT